MKKGTLDGDGGTQNLWCSKSEHHIDRFLVPFMGRMHGTCLFIAHSFANITIGILVFYSCYRYGECPHSLRPLSVTAEIEPMNLVFAFGMGTSALLTLLLIYTLQKSVTLYIGEKCTERSGTFSPREKQVIGAVNRLSTLGFVSYLSLFIVTITHAHRQGTLHSGFGLVHFFSSWMYSFGVQWVRYALINQYGCNDLEDSENSIIRFKRGQLFLLLLLVSNLIFGTLWFIVNLAPHMRIRLRGAESVWEVIAVSIQINYCCLSVLDKPGRCKDEAVPYSVLPVRESEPSARSSFDTDCGVQETAGSSNGVSDEAPYSCGGIVKMVCIGLNPCYRVG